MFIVASEPGRSSPVQTAVVHTLVCSLEPGKLDYAVIS